MLDRGLAGSQEQGREGGLTLQYRFGGREKTLADKAQKEAGSLVDAAKGEMSVLGDKAKEVSNQARDSVKKVTG